jgi:predicted ATPase
VDRVCAAIAPGRTLLILDSCEHVIEAAAGIAERLLKARPAVHVIATSREPLRAEGEYVYRVPSLDVPPDTAEGMTDPLQWAAVKLFVARAREAAPGFALDKHVAKLVAAICRRLDGIPLALELAATRTAALGVEALAARLDDRFALLTGGRRTALPRHQTLRATLDWSYELLSDAERVMLRRLAVFAGGFSLQAASAVAADKDLTPSDVVTSVADLVTKSLVTPGGPVSAAYRLLETTRAYAFEKLEASGEFEQCARRHAAYYGAVFQRADAEWERGPSEEWLSCYGPCLDNLRAAIDWALSPNGDRATGIALTVAALPLWFQLSLIDECLVWVGRALSALGNGARTSERQAMQLHAAHGWSLMYTTGPARETGAAWAAALQLAERLDDTDHRLRALWGLWAGHINNGEFRAALALAETFHDAAKKSTDAADRPVGERMLGVALHFLGDQTAARRHIEEMLCQYMPPSRGTHIVRFQFDQRVTARITLARVLWLQGFADQAMGAVESNLQDAVALNHSLSIGNALAQAACPIALFCGDLDAAERFIAMFHRHTARSALDVWHTYGRCFSGMLHIKRGDLPTGLALLLAGVDELRKAKFTQYATAFLLALAEGLAEAGRISEGLAAIDEGLARSGRTEERWCLAELLRVKGDLESMSADSRKAAAQQLYTEALECARLQGALSWELRAASSLARLWLSTGRAADARALLEPVRNRFTEGFGTMDLKSADELLSHLR